MEEPGPLRGPTPGTSVRSPGTDPPGGRPQTSPPPHPVPQTPREMPKVRGGWGQGREGGAPHRLRVVLTGAPFSPAGPGGPWGPGLPGIPMGPAAPAGPLSPGDPWGGARGRFMSRLSGGTDTIPYSTARTPLTSLWGPRQLPGAPCKHRLLGPAFEALHVWPPPVMPSSPTIPSTCLPPTQRIEPLEGWPGLSSAWGWPAHVALFLPRSSMCKGGSAPGARLTVGTWPKFRGQHGEATVAQGSPYTQP